MSHQINVRQQFIHSIVKFEQTKPDVDKKIELIIQQIEVMSKIHSQLIDFPQVQLMNHSVSALTSDIKELQRLSGLASKFLESVNQELIKRKNVFERGLKVISNARKHSMDFSKEKGEYHQDVKENKDKEKQKGPSLELFSETHVKIDDSLLSLRAHEDLKEIFSPRPLGEEFIEISPDIRPSAPSLEDQQDEGAEGGFLDVGKVKLMSDYFPSKTKNEQAAHQ